MRFRGHALRWRPAARARSLHVGRFCEPDAARIRRRAFRHPQPRGQLHHHLPNVSQLEARYDQAVANSIIGNCDRHLVLGFQDERTAKYFALRANKLPSTLLETPAGNWWLFERGRCGVCEPAYALEQHPRYRELIASCEMPGDREAFEDCEATATRKSSANRELAANLKAPACCEAFANCEASATWEAPEDFEAAADGEAPGNCGVAATWEAPENHIAFSICEDDDLDFLPPPGPDDEIWVDTLFNADDLDGDSGTAA